MWDEFGSEVLPTDNSSTTWEPPVAGTDVVSIMESGAREGADAGWGTWTQGTLDKVLGAWASIKMAEAVGQTYKAPTQIDPRTGKPYVAQRYSGSGVGVSTQGVQLSTQTLMLIGMGVMAFMLLKKG